MNKTLGNIAIGVALLSQSCSIKDAGITLNYVSGPTLETVIRDGGNNIYEAFKYDFNDQSGHSFIVYARPDAELVDMFGMPGDDDGFKYHMPKNLEYGDQTYIVYNDDYVTKIGDSTIIYEAGSMENLEPDTKFGNSYHYDDKIE